MERSYIAIDLKSFYASVECALRDLDPLTTNLVVADESRTDKTICLAVSPSLKAFGIPGRPRLFEVVQRVREVNEQRRMRLPDKTFIGSSTFAPALMDNPALAVDYVVAPPRMARYMEASTQIYQIYLQYIAPEDIHVYSIDEVFIDATGYLKTYGMTPKELARKLIREVHSLTGITATAGIGTNLYLCKVAMDIVAKHIPADRFGVRIAELDERKYRELLWDHRPLTDFWRVGPGYRKKLEANGMFTMGDIARRSLTDEDRLYKLFGVNAELLIDHAWGWEPCTMADIKRYKPTNNSLSSGQVLSQPYAYAKARLVVREMADLMSLDMVDKGVVADQMTLMVGYDIENLTDPDRKAAYQGPVVRDRYGRATPKEATGSVNLGEFTSSTKRITQAVVQLFEQIADPSLLVRRMYVGANHVIREDQIPQEQEEQLDLFTDYAALEAEKKKKAEEAEREKRRQKAILSIQKRFGKNAILKGMNYEEGATTKDRNGQVGGHKA